MGAITPVEIRIHSGYAYPHITDLSLSALLRNRNILNRNLIGVLDSLYGVKQLPAVILAQNPLERSFLVSTDSNTSLFGDVIGKGPIHVFLGLIIKFDLLVRVDTVHHD